jgi:AbrB family transcriptional regulator (stage V sporulation protein T)
MIMKATGMVRRLDDLGRIVIPKEIRRNLRIREGDPIEIYTNAHGEVILKKYSPIGDLGSFASQYAEALNQTTGHIVCIADKDQIIAAAGEHKKELINRPIGQQVEDVIEERNVMVLDEKQGELAEYIRETQKEVIAPIVCQGDAIGAVVILAKSDRNENVEIEKKLASTAASFLGKQME